METFWDTVQQGTAISKFAYVLVAVAAFFMWLVLGKISISRLRDRILDKKNDL